MSEKMSQVDIILNQKERNDIRISLIFRILTLTFVTVGHIISSHTPQEVIRVGIVSVFFLFVCVYFIWNDISLPASSQK
jgi:uncharacterized membrane protein YfcA